MIDFGALPPEINSTRMYTGPGPGSLVAAALAWDGLAAELQTTASLYRSAVAGLTTGRWLGPSSLSMASAFGPYAAWMAGTAARAAETASQAMLAVEAYEAAFAMTVPPPAVMANRAQLAALVASNFFGQNSAAIAATEAEYGAMWAQDAAAMYEYAANSAAASSVTPLVPPPQVANPAGVIGQATSVGKAAAGTGAEHAASIVSSVPTTLLKLASPSPNVVNAAAPGLLGGTLASLSPALVSLAVTPVYAIPSYFMAAATPLYVLSSSMAIAQSGQGMQATANAEQRAAAAAEAANPAATGGANPSLTSSVTSSVGKATSLGPLSVPASWTSVAPAAKASTAAALTNAAFNGENVANVPPSLLGGMPGALSRSGRPVGPRYGVVPTVMTRPPAGGYG
mgnify:CR=1 FL=1